MTARFPRLFLALALPFLMTAAASALVVDVPVTPDSVKAADNRFKISAEGKDDGLIHFMIIYRLSGPHYLVAHVEVRDGKELILKTDTPAVVREDTATYYVAVSRKHLGGIRFELAERTFVDDHHQAVPMPGGTDYQISLAAFAKDVVDSVIRH
jgi:hypothetical protein